MNQETRTINKLTCPETRNSILLNGWRQLYQRADYSDFTLAALTLPYMGDSERAQYYQGKDTLYLSRLQGELRFFVQLFQTLDAEIQHLIDTSECLSEENLGEMRQQWNDRVDDLFPPDWGNEPISKDQNP